MRKIRRAAWRIAALPFRIAAEVAGLTLCCCVVVLEWMERPELMTDAEKRKYYGYGRFDW